MGRVWREPSTFLNIPWVLWRAKIGRRIHCTGNWDITTEQMSFIGTVCTSLGGFFTVNKFIVTAQKVLRLGPVFHNLTRKMNRVSFRDRINLTVINTEPRSAIELWY